jgi:hypothetical protein
VCFRGAPGWNRGAERASDLVAREMTYCRLSGRRVDVEARSVEACGGRGRGVATRGDCVWQRAGWVGESGRCVCVGGTSWQGGEDRPSGLLFGQSSHCPPEPSSSYHWSRLLALFFDSRLFHPSQILPQRCNPIEGRSGQCALCSPSSRFQRPQSCATSSMAKKRSSKQLSCGMRDIGNRYDEPWDHLDVHSELAKSPVKGGGLLAWSKNAFSDPASPLLDRMDERNHRMVAE